jgi:hypothetical protein
MRKRIKSILSASILFIAGIIFSSFDLHAQTDSSFVPNGKPFALIFSNVNYTFNKEASNKAFELTRAYLGYEYSFSKNITSRLNLDIGDPGVGQFHMTAFIKNAFVQYKNKDLSARFGVISLNQFSLQEEHWGYRYIYMSFQDAYKFGSSADLGAAFEYSPSRKISVDISVLNGEGYKNIQIDSVFKTTFGVTIRPFKGFIIRGYYDNMKNDFAQNSFALFAAYDIKKFRAGVEYNLQKNNQMINGNDFSGISVYTSLELGERFSIFSRYDYLKSAISDNTGEPWNNQNDGQYFIAGFDYSPVKGVKISPSYIGYLPRDKTLSFISRLGLYFEISF